MTAVAAFTLPLPLAALLALVVRPLVAVARVGAARAGKSSLEISTTEAGEEIHAGWGVGAPPVGDSDLQTKGATLSVLHRGLASMQGIQGASGAVNVDGGCRRGRGQVRVWEETESVVCLLESEVATRCTLYKRLPEDRHKDWVWAMEEGSGSLRLKDKVPSLMEGGVVPNVKSTLWGAGMHTLPSGVGTLANMMVQNKGPPMQAL
ncbi:hypothetical protein B0H10DRAFT_1952330 [Mycena sp. CBHHK59/15]|nr:hypothetical protein B0H10DRAFT_1952330 [Mycena sp. CBHHK59/15]